MNELSVSSATHLARIATEEERLSLFRSVQGGGTDGVYAYQCVENQMNDYGNSAVHRVILVKIDLATGERVAVSEPYALDHANDLCHNPRTGELYVVHNGINNRRITCFDPKTLTPTRSFEIPRGIFALAYSATYDCYVAGVSGGQDIAIFDADFREIAYLPVERTEHTTQGFDCDDDYIYCVQSGTGRKTNDADFGYLLVYRWDGTRVAHLRVPLPQEESAEIETENIFHVGKRFYIGYNDEPHGGHLHSIDFVGFDHNV